MAFNFMKRSAHAGPEDGRFIGRLMQAFINQSLSPAVVQLVNGGDLDFPAMEHLLVQHGLSPLLHWLVIQAGRENVVLNIPPSLQADARTVYHGAVAENLRIQDQLKNILSCAQSHKVDLVPIKGASFLASLYKQFLFRRMSDIDVLIRREQLDDAQAVLTSMGYRKNLEGLSEKYWREHQYHFVFDPPGENWKRVELHWLLDYDRGVPVLPQLWNRLTDGPAEGPAMRVLSAEDALCSLALHWRHMGYNLNLKNVLDAALIIRQHSPLDSAYLASVARAGRFCTALYYLLFQAEHFGGVSMQGGFKEELPVPAHKRRLIEAFIRRNTFKPYSQRLNKWLFFISHLLLFDSYLESLHYMLHMPREQRIKFFAD